MDPATLALAVTTFLSPLLVKAGEKAAEAVGAKLPEQAGKVWSAVAARFKSKPLKGHSDWVRNVAFSPNGKMLASGSSDNTIILWDAATQQAIGSPLSGHTSNVWSVAFSPDGKALASGSDDNTIILWDVATRQPIGTPLTGQVGDINSVAFSPDGKMLASASDDKTIFLLDVSLVDVSLLDLGPEAWAAKACQRANRNLTQVEWKQYFGDELYRKTCEQWPEGK